MQLDARAAKLLTAGHHFTIDDCPGLRLKATATTRTWLYRDKSPVNGKMRQAKIGEWPAVCVSASIAGWEKLRKSRVSCVDAATEKRQAAAEAREADKEKRRNMKDPKLTVSRLCLDYHADRIEGDQLRPASLG
jgi:hypothetical protein